MRLHFAFCAVAMALVYACGGSEFQGDPGDDEAGGNAGSAGEDGGESGTNSGGSGTGTGGSGRGGSGGNNPSGGESGGGNAGEGAEPGTGGDGAQPSGGTGGTPNGGTAGGGASGGSNGGDAGSGGAGGIGGIGGVAGGGNATGNGGAGMSGGIGGTPMTGGIGGTPMTGGIGGTPMTGGFSGTGMTGGFSGTGMTGGVGGSATTCGGEACRLGEHCEGTVCVCNACPRGGLGGVPIEFCVTPQGTTASGPYFQDAPPSQAVDANKITTWTSGGYQGTLTVVLPAPTPMASVVLLPNGSWSPVPGVMYFTVIAKDANNQTRTLSGQFTDQNPTAWVELPLPAPMNIKEISISGQSGESWIGIWEVMYRSCAP